ncbi:beta-ketoacyl-[acyl-carrier-protein] synthase family protein [Leptospira sp. GIMC2001]|uniref:beta-ketoacyl-[acyl-carrier-protein] synthase family protein n=1 Tax=Leptospira sp. GIMC2001 TaxID=1513297 RepID=UPI00234B8171|nr:beta-ketoacyl-[acyl-carrier-protein] synthase family protein [Leptospira sp. GIMC2001]WCL50182.1 beta-ketoacyl-[acyl-carrier-protein] synthase family protein [Leptospira sp. GIMC2001]
MSSRVVITGLGVVAPNGHGIAEFEQALRTGKSGIEFQEKMKELNFACHVGGIPKGIREIAPQYFSDESLLAMNETQIYSGIAAIDAWKDAGLSVPHDKSEVNWDAGCVVGLGISGMDVISEKVIPMVNAGKTKRMGSTIVEQVMASGVSAKLSGILALGNQVTSNSSACNTGTEAIVMAFDRIRAGLADKMVAGGVEGSSPHVWAGFDAMKVINSRSNNDPHKASRPMSASAAGFVPGSGAGILILESLESAVKRNARIYAEILGANVNCGGHRMGGSMTAPNPISVRRCIQQALAMSGIEADQIDGINGHLTATFADPYEVENWSIALNLAPNQLPKIQSTKSMIGHCLGAAGAIESVATIIQINKGFLHKSINCEDLHEKILPYKESILHQTENSPVNIMAKASFGFGDVNGCLIFKKWETK